MPRIRSIKPDFWADEKLAGLDPLVRLVFLGLISMADDAGRLIDNIKAIDGQLFPVSDHSSRDALETLARLSRISRYTVTSGQKVIQIVNWHHQRIAHPSTHVLPPEQVSPILAKPSRDSREALTKPSRESHETLGPDVGGSKKDVGDKEVVPRERVRETEAHASRAEQKPFPSQSAPTTTATTTATAKPERRSDPGRSETMLRLGLAAYDKVERLVRPTGGMAPADYALLDFRERAGFSQVGGASAIRDVEAKSRPFQRKDFAEAYATAMIPGADAGPPVTAGP